MNENIEEIKKFLRQNVFEEFLVKLFARIEKHKQYLSEVATLAEKYFDFADNINSNNETEVIKEVKELNASILTMLESRFQLSEKDSLLNDLTAFDKNLENFVAESDETRTEMQQRERFYFQNGDKFYVRIGKYFKINLFKITVVPVKIRNTVASLFKKTKREIKYWNHIIPVRNIRSRYIRSQIYYDLSELYEKTLSGQSLSLFAIKKYCEQLENDFRENYLNLAQSDNNPSGIATVKSQFAGIIIPLENLKDEFKKRADEIIENIAREYYQAYLKAGTFELPVRKVSTQKVNKHENEIIKLYNKIYKGWNTTLFAIADDLRMDFELNFTRYKLINEFFKSAAIVSEKLNKNVKPSLGSVHKTILDLREQVDALNERTVDIKEHFNQSKQVLQASISETLIPRTIDILLEQEILNHIDDLEEIVEKSISEISDRRALVTADLYGKKIKESEISYISLRDMLSFSSLPRFKNFVSKTKADQSLRLQRIQNLLLEIEQICEFSLDSAQSMLHEKKGNASSAKKVFVEGLDRAIKKIHDIEDQLLSLDDSFAKKIKESLDDLNEELIRLTFNESVFELKLKITKDRALQKSREVRKETIKKVKNLLPHLIALAKKGYEDFRRLYSKTRRIIGLEKSVSTIKGEVSSFLSETGEAIKKLPFVYQRLFAIEPLMNERFFFGRDEELIKLNKAYENWCARKFSPTIIYGEKGSGATSLINLFLINHHFGNELIRISVTESLNTKIDFINLLYRKNGKSGNVELGELIEFLNRKNTGKKIIVLENLQHLFLRRINGFENLKALFELMSETNENVFWVTTCTIYGYRYLQKTVSISDYFANEIELGDLTDKQIIDIILKRHRVSGYDLYFETPENVHSNKDFQKLSNEEKQAQLEKSYFSVLNKFADSNISLALLFWVRSTSAISGEKITIGSLPKIDFSFLSALSNEKIFILNLLLIHDGLSEEDVSLINEISVERNRRLLMTLEDDGILIKRGKLFLINPLLYRPVVEQLKAKNIIH